MRVLALAAALLTAAAAPPPSAIQALLAAYPGQFVVDGPELVWPDGTRMAWSTGERSILEQVSASYPRGMPLDPPSEGADPGRARNPALLAKMYGDCRRGEVVPHLVSIPWPGGRSVRITGVNHIDRHLAAVARELDAPEWRRFLWPMAGTYVCRAVADTGEPSMHAYGAAIDINLGSGDYWLWRRAPWRNRVPAEIVAAFERHGFIWGGRWSHYDTMHFEYRPELLGQGSEDAD